MGYLVLLSFTKNLVLLSEVGSVGCTAFGCFSNCPSAYQAGPVLFNSLVWLAGKIEYEWSTAFVSNVRRKDEVDKSLKRAQLSKSVSR